MWDAVLDIGRPDTAQEMLIKAEAAFKKADDIWNLRKDDYFVNDEARARYWDDREKARLALEAARKKAEQQSQQDKNAQQQSDTEASRLKYTEEAQKAYERLQTPLEKYTARQEELNKALKDGKILQADYNTLMAAAKKDYEATLKKPKQSGVKVSAGDRQEDSAHAALLTLQAELRTLEKHAGANEKNQPAAPGFVEGGVSSRYWRRRRNVASCLHRRNPCWRIKMRRWSTNASWLHLATRLRIRSA